MQPPRHTIHSIGILTKPHRSEEIRTILEKLLPWLRERGHSYFLDAEGASTVAGEKAWDKSEIADRVDLLVVLGGDGTLLSASRAIAERQSRTEGEFPVIPILGVNLGSLGFLTEVQASELFEVLDNTLRGNYQTDARMMLKTRVIRHGRPVGESHVLNDVVINQGSKVRLIEFDIYTDALFVTALKGDGVIFSTPTGSTAYNLSAGGPIVYPEMEGIIMTPICPHTLTHRPLVLPGHARVEILIKKGESVTATFDGQVDFPLIAGDLVEITKSSAVTHLIVHPERNYFEVLRDKLKWGDHYQR